MKDTGIIRRIDDLGRIVIPKEIRKSIKLKEGDPLEFYSSNGELVLKKYSPLEKNEQFSITLLGTMSSVLEKNCAITDLEKVISASSNYKDLEGKKISDKLQKIILDKKTVVIDKNQGADDFSIAFGVEIVDKCALIVPIVKNGKAFGSIIVTDEKSKDEHNDFDIKAVRICSELLKEQFESV